MRDKIKMKVSWENYYYTFHSLHGAESFLKN